MKHRLTLCFFIMLFTCLSATAFAKDLNVGVILWRGETDADRAFIQKLRNQFTGITIQKIDVDQKIRNTTKVINSTWKNQLLNMDYIFAFGSRNGLYVRELLKTSLFKGTLIAFGNATELKTAHRIRDRTNEKLLLAVTELLPDVFFRTFLPLLDFKKIGVPYNLLEPQNVALLQSLKETGLTYNVQIVPIRTRPDNETLKSQLDKATKRVTGIDLLYLPLDSFLLTHTSLLSSCSTDLQVLAIGSNKKYVIEGIPLGLDSNFKDLGEKLAEQVIALETGTPLLSLPIVHNLEGQIVANRKVLNVRAPDLIAKLPPNTLFVD